MPRTAVAIDPRFLDHDTGSGHPERAARIRTLLDLVTERSSDFRSVTARVATEDELSFVHHPAYIEEVAATANREHFAFDADTPVCARSYEAARLAAGSLLQIVDSIVAGDVANGFALVRPPGHHAEAGRAMGFCLFNNVAVAAEYLRRVHRLERILVLDWDVHHGNGTQHMFEGVPEVLFVSTHQFPFYPGTGSAVESGFGDGTGFTVNVPLPTGCGDAEYAEAFERVILPIAEEYRPQFVLVSAGFDAHAADPLGGMRVSDSGFRWMARRMVDFASAACAGRVAAVLEGGYDLAAIRGSVAAVLDEFLAKPAEIEPFAASRVSPLLDRITTHQRQFWHV